LGRYELDQESKIKIWDKFNEAYSLLDQQKFELAELQFKQYLEQHPNDKLSISILKMCQDRTLPVISEKSLA
jgi:hypothetical protein